METAAWKDLLLREDDDENTFLLPHVATTCLVVAMVYSELNMAAAAPNVNAEIW